MKIKFFSWLNKPIYLGIFTFIIILYLFINLLGIIYKLYINNTKI